MANHSVARGICATCKHEPGCIYLADSDGMVLQCEEFEMAFPEPVATPIRTEPRRPSVNGDRSQRLAGLCQNCDNRDSCIYPKPEGGVWLCEEYA
jgi:hypothetical protein